MKKILVWIIIMSLVLSACTGPQETGQEGLQDTSQDTSQVTNPPATTGSQEGDFSVEVTLSGGSGRTTVASPAKVVLTEDQALATIEWSSENYDYMKVDGHQYFPINEKGHSTFEIPISFDQEMTVIADTTAMSQPHEIEYQLFFNKESLKPLEEGESVASSWMNQVADAAGIQSGFNRQLGNGWMPEKTMEIEYAENFKVDYYKGGLALIALLDGSRFLVVPQGGEVPEGIDKAIVVLNAPVNNIYLVATSAMCLFDGLDALDQIKLSGTDADGWYIENARSRMEKGQILYAGKYNAPDYELIMANDSQLSIQSTMINHNPEVKEKLEDVGIPVLVDQSSYESHPLGRTEWIKLYGLLVGKEARAESLFQDQVDSMEQVASEDNTGKTVAYFYINSSGSAVTRKSGDYVSKMIELAGGKYIFDNLGDSEKATSTVTLEMEHFFATAKDADYIIYNSTIGGEVYSIDELLAKNSLLEDFKAVKEGNVWCTSQNLYQETTGLGQAISDIHQMLIGQDDALTEGHFIYHLE